MDILAPLEWLAHKLAESTLPPGVSMAIIVLVFWAAGVIVLAIAGAFIWWQPWWIVTNLIGRFFLLFWTVICLVIWIGRD